MLEKLELTLCLFTAWTPNTILIHDEISKLSPTKEAADHSACNISRQSTGIKGVRSHICSLAELITP
jgi:hypothetical protein